MSDSWSIIWLILFLAYLIIPAKVYGKLSEDVGRGKKWWGWVPLPLFRFCLLLEIAGMSGWWILSIIFPFVSNLALAKIWYNISKIYNKSTSESIIAGILGFFILGIIPAIYYAYFGNSLKINNKNMVIYGNINKKESIQASSWMNEAQRKEFESLAKK